MRKIFNSFWKDALIKGSVLILMGSLISNFGTYLFHLVMGRLLGPANYGILESLVSITYFLGIPISVLGLVIVKYVSREKHDKEKVATFIKKISRKLFVYGFVVHLVFILSFPILKNLVKVDSFVLFLGLGIGSFLSIYLTIFSSVLQGIMRFAELSFFSIFTSWSKLIIAVALVLVGLKIEGAIYAIVLSTLLAVFFGYKIVRKYVPLNFKGDIDIKNSFANIGSYSLAVFLSQLCLISFFTTDIILARYFLSPIAAGQYASLSVLGKIIFFASSPIVSVMFPMVSEKHTNGGNYQKLLWFSFFIVMIICFIISVVYFSFPKQMIGILFGGNYLSVSADLGLFAIFISIYALCSLLMNFYLSISKIKPIFISTFIAIFQIILISFYHQTIRQIVWVNIISLSLLLIGLLIYYSRDKFLTKSEISN